MDKTNTRLHPLLTAAAISVTVFSAVGVATLTGLVPPSIGSQKEEIMKPVEPAVSQPVPRPAAKPVKKPVAKVSKPRAAEPVAYRDFAEAPAATPVPQVVEAPRPAAPIGLLGTVEDVKEVTTPGEHTAMGPIAGGVAGAVIGSQIGGGNGKKVMTVLGALGGAMAGKHIEKQARGEKRWETVVRLEDGSQRTVQSAVQPFWHAGDRVRYVDGRLQPV
jgi:outer membrane lipoprotein SlyB